jgi:hypothetical protein
MPENFANRGPLHSALREMQSIITNPRLLAVFGIIVLVFTVTGPFGTLEAMGFAQRLGYWFGAQATSWTIAIFSITVADKLFGERISSEPLRVLATGAVAGVPVSLAALLSSYDLWMDGRWPGTGEVARVFFTSIPLTIGFSALSWLVLGGREAAATATSAAAPPVQETEVPSILTRLPAEKRGPLIRLSAADHYVEIVTANGTGLALMRLVDAIAETAPVDGVQVHRSHWVALSAVSRLQTSEGKSRLILNDGVVLPVSRALAAGLRTRLVARRK